MQEGLHVKQSEVHGMSQRGGAVLAHLRLCDRPIASSLVPRGAAALILGLEPLEALRYLRYLSRPRARLSARWPPSRSAPTTRRSRGCWTQIRSLPGALLVDAERLARAAGRAQAANVVLAGAASHRLPLEARTMERYISQRFARQGAKVVRQNLTAFNAGREVAAPCPSLA